MILNLLNRATIETGVEVSQWKEAGRKVGKLLVDSGGVESSYVEAMISSVEKYGPYIVIAPGVALFHGRPQEGVKKLCMGLITLKKGIPFNAGDKDPVKIVFAFGALDHNSHVKALAELMGILQNKDCLRKLSLATNEEEVLQLIKAAIS